MDIRPPMVISLAKREEEVYIQTRTTPVLPILQQIRDEAHRFAQHDHHMRHRKRAFVKDVKAERRPPNAKDWGSS